MKASMTRAALCLPLMVIFIFASEAARNRPPHPPAENPQFELIETGPGHAVVRYVRGNKPLNRMQKDQVFVAVPVNAEFDVKPVSWRFELEPDQRDERVLIEGAAGDLIEGTTDPADMAMGALETQRRQFHEVDAIEISVSPVADSGLAESRPAYRRDKVHIERLDLRVEWSGGLAPHQADPRGDAGFSLMYEALFVNHEQARAIRAKRPMSDDEAMDGFHAASIGYDKEGALINALSGPVEPRSDGLRFLTRDSGVMVIRPADLRVYGFDPSTIDAEQLRLWHLGKQQPLAVLDSDGRLSGTDAIVFYADEPDQPFSGYGYYFLTWSESDESPLRVETQPLKPAESGAPAVMSEITLDSDRYLVKKGLRSFDWFYDQVDALEKVYPVTLDGLAAEGEIKIEVSFYNKMRDLPGFALTLGEAKKHYRTRPDEASTAEFVLSASGLIESPTLAITLDKEPPDVEGLSGVSDKIEEVPYLFIDSIRVVYPRTVDMDQAPLQAVWSDAAAGGVELASASFNPRFPWSLWTIDEGRLSGRYTFEEIDTGAFVPPSGDWDSFVIDNDMRLPLPYLIKADHLSTLRRADQGYDLVFIAYDTLIDSVRPLAERRAEEGFKVLLTDVQDVYDEFNFGYPSPEAIKRFLQYGQSRWTGLSPEFVVLTGDASWDHRDNEGTGMIDQVPTFAPRSDPQRFASDEWYGWLWGGGDDYYSDVIVGRISLRTPEEVSDYVEKTLTYENAPVGPWKTRNLWVSDDTFERYPERQAETSVPGEVNPVYVDQASYPHVTNPYLYHRFYGSEDPAAQEYLNKKYSPETTLAILDELDRGALLFQYIGHGGNQLWSHERIFYGTDRPTSNVLELEPTDRFPFVMSWSCLTGLFNYNRKPFHICLSEEFIRYPDRGAIAVWGPSGGGTTDQHMVLSHLVMRGLFDDGLERLGEATVFAKAEFMHMYSNSDLIEQYVFFGDPTLKLNTPQQTVPVETGIDYFVEGPDQEFTVSVSGIDFATGQAVVSMSIGRLEVYQSRPFPIQNGGFEHTFTASIDDAPLNTATFRFYAWNEDLGRDAWGSAERPRFQPVIALENASGAVDNGLATIRFDVVNQTPFPVEWAEVEVQLGYEPEALTVENVPANGRVTAEWSGEAPVWAYRAYITAKPDPYTALEVEAGAEDLSVELGKPEGHPLAPILGQIRFNVEDLIQGDAVRMRVPFENFSEDETVSIATWISGPGADDSIMNVTLDAGRSRTLDYRIDLPADAYEASYSLHVEGGDETSEFLVPIYLQGKPDLALAEGELTYLPRTAVVGQTVYLKTTVYNVGDGPAENIRVEAYLGDPGEKRRLMPFNRAQRVDIDRLEPGEMKDIELTWDPEGFEGEGSNQVFVVVDPNDRIIELDEMNNRTSTVVTLNGLPDLSIDPWIDHEMELVPSAVPAVWGDPLRIESRTRNQGDSPAEYVRMSVQLNDEEITRFFDRINKNSLAETRFEVPITSSKNLVSVSMDKYDLIGEKGEATGNNNNDTLTKRIDVLLQMPLAPVDQGERVYRLDRAAEFSAGQMEFMMYNEDEQRLELIPGIEDVQYRVVPAFVQDPNAYSLKPQTDKWHWFSRFNVFVAPTGQAARLPARIPSPQGAYDVYVKLFSPAYPEGETAKIDVKTGDDADYFTIEHREGGAPGDWYHLGEKRLVEDEFLMDFRSVPGSYNTNVIDVNFKRSESGQPVSANYISPLFPAAGATGRPATISWQAETPPGTSMIIRARWALRNPDGSLRYFPWAKRTAGGRGELTMNGKGDFIQFQAQMTLLSREFISPWLKNVEVRIPARSAAGQAE